MAATVSEGDSPELAVREQEGGGESELLSSSPPLLLPHQRVPKVLTELLTGQVLSLIPPPLSLV